MDIEVVIEVAAGSRNKYEIDHQTGVLRLNRTLFTAARYPVDYGFIEGTRGSDGDPVDALVLLEEPAIPGCHLTARAVAVLWVEHAGGREPKVLVVPSWKDASPIHDVEDVSERLRREIGQFFEVYKDIGAHQSITVDDWGNRTAAERVIRAGRREHKRGG